MLVVEETMALRNSEGQKRKARKRTYNRLPRLSFELHFQRHWI